MAAGGSWQRDDSGKFRVFGIYLKIFCDMLMQETMGDLRKSIHGWRNSWNEASRFSVNRMPYGEIIGERSSAAFGFYRYDVVELTQIPEG
jgi:hypothetical protein